MHGCAPEPAPRLRSRSVTDGVAGDGPTNRLTRCLAAAGPLVVGFSGGVDSGLLAHVALEVLGAPNVLAVTARSPSVATGELDLCRDLAASWGLPWIAVDTDEMSRAGYVANGPDRCAWCREALMDRLAPIAAERGAVVALGVNLDDLDDHRPGQAVARRRGAVFPLVDAGLSKADVRTLARRRGLSTWNRPASPCLSSRIPYGTPVTVPLLRRLDRAEAAVRSLGFSDVRVRHHGDIARIEVPRAELGRAVERSDELTTRLRSLGYRYVVLDLAGLRSGNLNWALTTAAAAVPGDGDGFA